MSLRKTFQKGGELVHIQNYCDSCCGIINFIAQKSLDEDVNEVSLSVEELIEGVRCNNREELFQLIDKTGKLRVKVYISVNNDLKQSVKFPLFNGIDKENDIISGINVNELFHEICR